MPEQFIFKYFFKNIMLYTSPRKPVLHAQKLFRYIFWIGYIAVLVTTFIPVAGSINKVKLGPENFQIKLDHLLHFAVYFIICMYYLAGHRKALILFNASPFVKFILLLLFLAVVTELAQLWVPERTFNVFDLVSNVSGLVIGVGLIKMAQRNKLPSLKLRRSKGTKA